MRIIGIDPGSVLCGYGVINSVDKSISIIEFGTIEVKKKTENFNLRLKEIYDRISEVVRRTNPEVAAIENTFYSKNPQSLIKLSQARAAAILAIANHNIPISEYSAREIKKSVSGRGAATKEQVEFMVRALLKITADAKYFDTTDALAIAICHSNKCNAENTNKPKTWEQFFKSNPNRIIKI